MTKKSKIQSGAEILVPLNKLKKSPRNVRKTPHTSAEIDALAASIGASGMLQNLVVEPELAGNGAATGFYLVTVGEGRRLAQLLRAKRRHISKTEPVRCLLETERDAHEVSLAENVVRSAMHPADEYAAFAVLHHEKGMAAEDIAARFGVVPAVVRQRLKLAAVSPTLMELYRGDAMTLEQLMAFTVTDDHARQEEVWHSLGWDNGGDAIRRALTEGQVATTDRRARFVGVDEYVQAGGVITRDLFDDANGGYVADATLLERLLAAKLEREAHTVRSEGWAWVAVTPEFDHRAAQGMRRVYPQPAEVDGKTQRKIDKLSLEYDELAAVCENEEVTDAMQTRLSQLEADIDILKGEPAYSPADIAMGGAFVSLGYDGGLRVERGFIRKADEHPAPRRESDAAGEGPIQAESVSNTLPDRLVAQLTAHRTAVLRNAVADRPDVAFVAIVHALAAATFYVGSKASCLDVSARSAFLSAQAPGIDETSYGRTGSDRHAALAATLPEDAQDLWDRLRGWSQEQLMRLLAHCAALTIDGVTRTGQSSSASIKHTDMLAQAVSLDMAAHWQPTATNYFGQVTKAVIAEAVRNGVSEQAAKQIADLKKPAMAEAAERLLADKGWLPVVLRLPQGSDAMTVSA